MSWSREMWKYNFYLAWWPLWGLPIRNKTMCYDLCTQPWRCVICDRCMRGAMYAILT